MTEKNEDQKQNPSKSKYWIGAGVIVLLAICSVLVAKDSKKTTDMDTKSTIRVEENVTNEIKKENIAVENENMARIDISTPLAEDGKSQFEIYVDGSEEPLKRAFWMYKKRFHGFTIQKSETKFDIVIKTVKDADITLFLRSIQKRENKINIPVWVTYTSLTINDKEILNEAKSVWFNEPFEYHINAKAGEEYKIHTEWQKPDNIPEK